MYAYPKGDPFRSMCSGLAAFGVFLGTLVAVQCLVAGMLAAIL